LAVAADAVIPTAHDVRDLLRSPLISVASALVFGAGTARPQSDTHSLAERVSEIVDVPVLAGLHSLAAGKLAREKPDEDALEGGRPGRAARRHRAFGACARACGRPRPAPRRGDSPRVGGRRSRPPAARDRGDAARIYLRLSGCGLVQCARAGHAGSPARGSG